MIMARKLWRGGSNFWEGSKARLHIWARLRGTAANTAVSIVSILGDGSQTRTGRERWSGGVRAVLIPERVGIETNNLNQKGGEYGKLEI